MAKRRRKRGYGSGSIVPPEVPGGTWTVRVRLDNGRRIRRGGLPSRELAERVAAKIQADGVAEQFGLKNTDEAGTLTEFAVGFLRTRQMTHRAYDMDKGRWNKHLKPFFGHCKPSEVDQGMIRRFAETKLRDGLASGTIRVMVALLSSLYEELIEDKQAQLNPCRKLPKRTQALMRPSHDPKTTPFIERLSDIDRIFRELPEPLNIAYALGAMGGLRTSEQFAVSWPHVDFDMRKIHVRQQLSRRKGELFVPVKDKDSRIVPILDGLMPILKAWKMKTGGTGMLVPPLRLDGRHINHKTPGHHFRKALKKLGLERPGLAWYQATRHTFASQWVMNGGSIEKLKEILGHYSVVVTERYTHLKPELFTDKDHATIPLTLGQGVATVREIGPALARPTLKGGSK